MFLLDTGVSWQAVALAAIGAIPGIIAAVGVILNRRMLQTPSGTSIGTQVEDINHTGIVTHHNVSTLVRRGGETPQSNDR